MTQQCNVSFIEQSIPKNFLMIIWLYRDIHISYIHIYIVYDDAYMCAHNYMYISAYKLSWLTRYSALAKLGIEAH